MAIIIIMDVALSVCPALSSKPFTCINPGRPGFKSQVCYSLALCSRVSIVLLVYKDIVFDEVTLVKGLLPAHDDLRNSLPT